MFSFLGWITIGACCGLIASHWPRRRPAHRDSRFINVVVGMTAAFWGGLGASLLCGWGIDTFAASTMPAAGVGAAAGLGLVGSMRRRG